jgi:Ser/Thr protein kinase RdoA (MazF antagonist)
VAPTHGDYYRRNLLCANNKVVGVIDWHDSAIRPLAAELASATFELCKNDEHVLQFDTANEFVRAYREAGGPIHDSEINLLLPLIRVWLRNDALLSLAYDGHSGSDYATKQVRAFSDLAYSNWTPGD